MKITFVETISPDIRAYGIRCISSYLKENGHDVRLVFLPPGIEKLRSASGVIDRYDDNIIDQTIDLCSDGDVVGIGLVTYYFERVSHLTRRMKDRLDIPVIWGGIHPTTRPGECLEYADLVCRGEGDEAILQFLNRMEKGEDYRDAGNFWFKENGEIHKNNPLPLIQDLDGMPFPDWDFQEHYALDHAKTEVRRIDEDLMRRFMSMGPVSNLGMHYHYKTMASRGCPHRCKYCCVSYYRDMYEGQRYLRRRSIENVMQELSDAREKLPFMDAVSFFDDCFFTVSTENIREFAAQYKRKIGLPFATQSSPPSTTRDKLQPLVDAGMVYLEMGIQTGSRRIQRMYGREFPREKVIRAAESIIAFKDRMLPPDYHLILDNPWENEEDVLDTLYLILDLPHPFGLKPSSLVLYPETGLYHNAISENLIQDEKEEIYSKAFGAPSPTYLNLLIFIAGTRYFPKRIVRFMAWKPLRRFFRFRIFEPFYALFRSAVFAFDRIMLRLVSGKKIRHLSE